jgi:hypothetical protein
MQDRPAISFFGFVFHRRRRRRRVVSKQNVVIGRVSTQVYKRILYLSHIHVAAIPVIVHNNNNNNNFVVLRYYNYSATAVRAYRTKK